MSGLDLSQVKARRTVMLAVNGLAAVAAVGLVVAWIIYDQSWALIAFIAALLAGFAAQVWFIVGLKGRPEPENSPARDPRTGKGA